MRIGLGISVVVHVSILLAAVIVLPEPKKYLTAPEESIPVEIIEFSDTTKQVATLPNTKSDPVKNPLPPKVDKVGEPLKDAQPAKKIKKAALEPTPAPEPEPEPVKAEETPPEPDPVKELIEKVEKQPEAEPAPEAKKIEAVAKPIPVPRRKPKIPDSFKKAKKKKKKKSVDLNKLAALLNKIDDKRTAPPAPADETGTPSNGEIANLIGRDNKITGSEIQWLISRISQCWSPPIGMKESGAVIPRVQFEMDIKGNVLGTPRVTNNSSNPLFDVAARSAINAILSCGPYAEMPPEKFDSWRTIAVRFDPRKMLGIN